MSSIFNTNASKALLILSKDFTRHYNANSLSAAVGLTPRGTLKLLKRLEADGLVVSKQLGKATFYKANLDDPYTRRLIALLLQAESREKAGRWLEEFKELFDTVDIAILFGSAAKDPGKARDTDVLLVFEESKEKKVDTLIKKIRSFSVKPIHTVKQGPEDLRKNLGKADKVLLDILSHGIVLHGHNRFTDVLAEFTRLP